jgi:dihydroorotate dehydrogenase (NAD+) catalytic subunit
VIARALRRWGRSFGPDPAGRADAALAAGTVVDLATYVGALRLPNPVLTAAGTSGHGAELQGYFDLDRLGAVVVKSLSAQPWDGNPAPRVATVDAGMLNSVGLQNAGVAAWSEHDLVKLRRAGGRTVVSIWGFTADAYEAAAALVAPFAADPSNSIVAVEVNVSCPNVEDRRHMFAHSPEGTATVVRAVRRGLGGDLGGAVPVWAKLSPNVTSVVDIAGAAADAGADAVTLVNTVMGLRIDPATRRPVLGAGGGGLSGPAIRPVAVRAVYEVRAAHPTLPIVGVGGITRGEHAVEFLLAGANAVEVGTATFYEPAAPVRILGELTQWCGAHGVRDVSSLIGAAHA